MADDDQKVDDQPTVGSEPTTAEESTEQTVASGPKAESSATQAEKLTTPSPSDNARWYIVHTYSGHEDKVAKSLKQRVESMGFEEKIFDIIVPTRNTIKVSQGKKEN